MTKLTDTQLVVLSAAAARDDGSLLPLPKSLKGGAAGKVLDSLVAKGLAEKIVDNRIAVPDAYKITRAGLVAINADPDESAPAQTGAAQAADDAGEAEPAAKVPAKRKKAATRLRTPKRSGAQARRRKGKTAPIEARAPREGTKQAVLIDMLRRSEGATIEQIVERTGWQKHTVRGAISGALKKKLGLTVTSEKVEGTRVYRIVDPA